MQEFFGHTIATDDPLELAEAVLVIMKRYGFPRESVRAVMKAAARLREQQKKSA